MGLFQQWFDKPAVAASRSASGTGSESARDETRRELLSLAVRDTLRKHGIPTHWISAETHSAMTGNRVRGMHLRLVVREWQPKLLAYTVALQKAVQARLIRLDPLAPSWIAGVSWRFEVVDEAPCPELPAAHYWQAAREEKAKPLGTRALLDALLSSREQNPRGLAEGSSDFRPTEPMPR